MTAWRIFIGDLGVLKQDAMGVCKIKGKSQQAFQNAQHKSEEKKTPQINWLHPYEHKERWRGTSTSCRKSRFKTCFPTLFVVWKNKEDGYSPPGDTVVYYDGRLQSKWHDCHTWGKMRKVCWATAVTTTFFRVFFIEHTWNYMIFVFLKLLHICWIFLSVPYLSGKCS